MSYSEYKNYGKTQLANIFKLTIKLMPIFDFKQDEEAIKKYAEFQNRMDNLAARTRIANTNEATRIGLLVSPILIEASILYDLGLFFEQPFDLTKEETPDLPHQLNGAWDGALTLDSLDFSAPIISIVEVKPNKLSDGLGQCIAEMYATKIKFKQEKIYGIITDGEVWEFLLLKENKLLIHSGNCHISNVIKIIGNIGCIVKEFN